MATLPEVHRTEIDGVPVFWVDAPGRLSARLLFGVGLADETFLTTGITHLVEHLTMRQVGESPYAANASVGTFVTEFEVSSTPDVVIGHLDKVCRALSSLDVAPLDLERTVIGAEEQHHDHGPSPLAAWPLLMRYGCSGPGLLAATHVAPHRADQAEVGEWCRRWFHRANAALVLDGPPPAGLRLALDDGEPIRREIPEPLPWTTPAWREIEDGVIAGMVGRHTAALSAGAQILERRLTNQLRHELGLVYEIGAMLIVVPTDELAIGLGTELPDEHVDRVTAALVASIDALGADGPTPEELAFVRDGFAEDVTSSEFVAYAAYDEAAAWLRGLASTRPVHEELLAGVPAEEVAEALRAARATMIVGVAEGHEVAGLPRLPESAMPVVEGEPFKRRLFSVMPRGSRLLLGADGITLYTGREAAPSDTVRFADVAAVGVEPGPFGRDEGDEIFVLHAGTGDTVPVRARDWRGGQAIVDAVRSNVPAALFFDAPEALRVFDVLADD